MEAAPHSKVCATPSDITFIEFFNHSDATMAKTIILQINLFHFSWFIEKQYFCGQAVFRFGELDVNNPTDSGFIQFWPAG